MNKHFLAGINNDSNDDVTDNHARDAIEQLINSIKGSNTTKPIVGQDELIKYMVICLIMGEHALLEGLPGLAKTQVAERLAKNLGLNFQRAQFVPDMMPSDLIYRQTLKANKGKTQDEPVQFETADQFGKVFTNILVADEINRAPSKVQAALLEACEERKVSILTKPEPMQVRPQLETNWIKAAPTTNDIHLAEKYFGLKHPDKVKLLKEKFLQHFMVIATMNPLEQEGVYPLSEAQFDRFAFRLNVNQPKLSDYKGIAQHAFVNSIKEELSNVNKELSNSTSSNGEKQDTPEQIHQHVLFFLTWLKQRIFSQGENADWNKVDSIRENLELLINFTHMKKWHNYMDQNDNQTPIATSEYDEKQNDLLTTLKSWEIKVDKGETDKPYKQWLQKIKAMQNNNNYPDINAGVSPRGLLKLIKAIHVLAYINDEQVAWHHVRHMAHPILAHRLNVSPNRLGKSDPSQFIEDLLDCFEPKYDTN